MLLILDIHTSSITYPVITANDTTFCKRLVLTIFEVQLLNIIKINN